MPGFSRFKWKERFFLATNFSSFLDVSDIKFVINVDYPSSSEDYIHRIGRTARSDRHGTAYTFFTNANAKQAKDLVNVLREANQQVNNKLLELVELSRNFGGKSMLPNRRKKFAWFVFRS